MIVKGKKKTSKQINKERQDFKFEKKDVFFTKYKNRLIRKI